MARFVGYNVPGGWQIQDFSRPDFRVNPRKANL